MHDPQTTVTDEQVRAYLTAVHVDGMIVPHRSVGEWLERGKADLERAARILRPEQVTGK